MDEHPMSMKEQLEILTQGKGPQVHVLVYINSENHDSQGCEQPVR